MSRQQIAATQKKIRSAKAPPASDTAEPGEPIHLRDHTFLPFDDSKKWKGQCKDCKSFSKAWIRSEQGIDADDLEIAIDWAIDMYEEFYELVPRRLFLLDLAYTFTVGSTGDTSSD